jgi:hypothetical protein
MMPTFWVGQRSLALVGPGVAAGCTTPGATYPRRLRPVRLHLSSRRLDLASICFLLRGEAMSIEDPRGRTLQDGSDMAAAMARLNDRLDERNRDRLNEAIAEVYLTHQHRPVELIMAVLMRKTMSAVYEPRLVTLRPAA